MLVTTMIGVFFMSMFHSVMMTPHNTWLLRSEGNTGLRSTAAAHLRHNIRMHRRSGLRVPADALTRPQQAKISSRKTMQVLASQRDHDTVIGCPATGSCFMGLRMCDAKMERRCLCGSSSVCPKQQVCQHAANSGRGRCTILAGTEPAARTGTTFNSGGNPVEAAPVSVAHAATTHDDGTPHATTGSADTTPRDVHVPPYEEPDVSVEGQGPLIPTLFYILTLKDICSFEYVTHLHPRLALTIAEDMFDSREFKGAKFTNVSDCKSAQRLHVQPGATIFELDREGGFDNYIKVLKATPASNVTAFFSAELKYLLAGHDFGVQCIFISSVRADIEELKETLAMNYVVVAEGQLSNNSSSDPHEGSHEASSSHSGAFDSDFAVQESNASQGDDGKVEIASYSDACRLRTSTFAIYSAATVITTLLSS